MTTCSISCSLDSSQQVVLDSGHQGLLEPRANEFLYELDIDNGESVSFQIADFTHGGSDYSVAVTATRQGGNPESWSHDGQACNSSQESSEAELSISVVATPTSGTTSTGGGIIRILPKGRPDR